MELTQNNMNTSLSRFKIDKLSIFMKENWRAEMKKLRKEESYHLQLKSEKNWLTKFRLQTRDCVNSTSFAGHNTHTLDSVRRKSDYHANLERSLTEDSNGTTS